MGWNKPSQTHEFSFKPFDRLPWQLAWFASDGKIDNIKPPKEASYQRPENGTISFPREYGRDSEAECGSEFDPS